MVSEAVRTAWQINEAMNIKLLTHLSPEMLSLQISDHSDTIAAYLAHIAISKKWWGKHLNEEQVAALPSLYSKTDQGYIVSADLAHIQEVFEQTSKIILETAEHATDKGKLPYPSIDVYLIQQMIHDAHHRGQILLTLRTAGHTPPDDDDFWGGWWPDQQET
jgi:uncharacterized damage-inducible protein DinB